MNKFAISMFALAVAVLAGGDAWAQGRGGGGGPSAGRGGGMFMGGQPGWGNAPGWNRGSGGTWSGGRWAGSGGWGRPVWGTPGWGRPGWGGVWVGGNPGWWGWNTGWWAPGWGVSVGVPVVAGWPTIVSGSWTAVPVDAWSAAGTSESLAWVESPAGSGTFNGGVAGGGDSGAGRGSASPATASSNAVLPPANYWYYCASPAGYFPYVQQCASAWIPVIPQAPSAAGTPPQVAPVRSSPSRAAPGADASSARTY
jgi:hypothetical protein